MLRVLLLFSVSLLLPQIAVAQTVTKVKDKQAWVSISPSQNFVVGETVHFLNDSLKRGATGTVKTISDGKANMIVDLTEGTASPGMSVEKQAQKPAPQPPALTESDRRILSTGEISTARYVIGGVIGTYPIGLGVGHAIQGRYAETGWIFTAGELASIAVLAIGLGDCDWGDWDNDEDDCDGGGMIAAGIIGYVGFRVVEIVDVWVGPLSHNRRYRELQSRQNVSSNWDTYVVPTQDGGKFVFQLSF